MTLDRYVKAWGKVVAYSNGNLLAEAPDGT